MIRYSASQYQLLLAFVTELLLVHPEWKDELAKLFGEHAVENAMVGV